MSDEKTTPTPDPKEDTDNTTETTPTPDYPDPVNKLLTLGHPSNDFTKFDYHEIGVRLDQKDELLRMIDDEDLHDADPGSDLIWAPVHAWRALTQMQDPSVAGAIAETLFWRIEDDDDWVLNEMPTVMTLLGPKTLPALNAYLDPEKPHGLYPRWLAIDCMTRIADAYADMDRVVFALFLKQLEQYEKHIPEVNAYLIARLPEGEWIIDSEALVNKAIMAERVDLAILQEMGVLDITTTEGKAITEEERRQLKKKAQRKSTKKAKRKKKK